MFKRVSCLVWGLAWIAFLGGRKDWSLVLSLFIIIHSTYLIPGVLCGLRASKSATIGGQQVLDCDQVGNVYDQQVTYIIQWKKDGVEKPIYIQYNGYAANIHELYESRVRLVQDFSLEISHIRESDEGWYECKVLSVDGIDNENPSSNGTWIYLNVHVPPQIVSSSPKSFHQPLGSTVRIFCQAQGSPPPTVSWTKDGRPVLAGPRLTFSSDDTEIVITNLQENDGGIFKCTFKNAVGLITQTIHLIVEGQAYIIGAPSNKTAVRGQRITFSCQAKGYPANITYRWYKDSLDQNVNMLLGYGDRIQVIDSSGSLIIKMVEKIDMGWYYCRPSNGVGQDPEASAFLNVTYTPEVLKDQMPRSLIWALGFQERLDCPVDANPPVSQIVWAKDGTQVIAENFDHIQQLNNGSLLITRVRTTDTGNYRCTAMSTFGSGDSEVIQIEVKDPPRFTVRPESQYIRQPGYSVLIPCAAAGTPVPLITWRKLQGVLVYDGRIQLVGGNLSINSLQKTDHGDYECEASNPVAKVVIGTEIIVQNTTPHAPYNITVETSLFSAAVHWLPSYSSSPQLYTIWYRTIINNVPSSWQTMKVEPPDTTRFTIYNLAPDTTYHFKVLSRNQYGDGQFSNTVETKTMGNDTNSPTQKYSGYVDGIATALPTDSSGSSYIPTIRQPLGPTPSRPVNVSLFVGSDGLITVTWETPSNSSVKIFYYSVEMSNNGGQTWDIVGQNIEVPTTSFSYKPDKVGVTYIFRVYACSLLSYSRPSPVVSHTVNEDAGLHLSVMEIGGIVGGLLFLLVAVVLTVIAVMCNKRRERERKRASKYDNVKYLGPADDIDASRPEFSPEWSPYNPHGGGGDSLRQQQTPARNQRDDDDGIFTTPHSRDVYDGYSFTRPETEKHWADSSSRFYDGENLTHDTSGVTKGSWPRSKSRGDRSRSRSRERSYNNNSSNNNNNNNNNSLGRSAHSVPYNDENGFKDDNGFLPTKGRESARSRKRRRHRPAKDVSPSHLRGNLIGDDSGGHPDVSFHDNSFQQRLPPHSFHNTAAVSQPTTRSPRHSVHTPLMSPVTRTGQDQNNRHYLSYLDDDDDEEVFMPPPISTIHAASRPGFPRHSSMKPAQQTYLTDDFVPPSPRPFIGSDLSSVLPSPSVTDLAHAQYRPYQRQYSDLSPKVVPAGWKGDPDRSRFSDNLDNTVLAAAPRGQGQGQGPSLPARGISREESNSSDSSGRPVSYTRDHLHGVVERVRKGPRARKPRGPRGSASELDSISESAVSPWGKSDPGMDDTLRPTLTGYNQGQDQGHQRRGSYRTDADSHNNVGDSRTSVSSSGLGSNSGHKVRVPDSRSYGREDLTPDSISSGIGSRNTSSQLTGSSLQSRPPVRDWSQDSSPYLDYPSSLGKRDVSGDENYEFDSMNAVESDLMEALRNYSEVNNGNDQLLDALQTGLNSSQFYNELYPKPRRESRYSDSEKRFEKLRGEFHQYREKQRERHQNQPGSGVRPSDSSTTFSSRASDSLSGSRYSSGGGEPLDSSRYILAAMDSDML